MAHFCSNCGTSNGEAAKFCSNCGQTLVITLSKDHLPLGTLLDRRYEILSLVRAGGMGSVYKARDVRLKRDCAVKEMFGEYNTLQEQNYAIKRFEEEAFIMAHLTHMNLPVIIDYFIEKNRYYIVMEFIDGIDLEEILKKEGNPGLSEDKVVRYALQILDVLAYLHNQNPPVIYRDIKPSNIMIRTSDERPILVDFGIARTVQSESKTQKTIIGTPGYLSPEQWKGTPEIRSDLYSLGATLHHLLSGLAPLPFNFEHITAVNKDISPELERIIIKSLDKNPENRFACAEEMKKALQSYHVKPPIYVSSLKEELPPIELHQEEMQIEFIEQEKCNKCEKLFPLSDLFIKDQFKYCLDCISSAPSKISALTARVEIPVQSIVHPKDNSEMILISRGAFKMGSTSSIDEKPVHEIILYDYYIDKYPVTYEQYTKFTQETGYVSQGNWMKYYSPQKMNYPVVEVTWYDAKAYATWSGKLLPTEAEWEKASRSNDQREYPWGNLWEINKCNNRKMDLSNLLEKMIVMMAGRGTLPPGSFPDGKSPYGVMDMAGNINEWCSDWYDNKYYTESPEENP